MITNTITDAKFFRAGNALFTVSNPSGQHFTFKIRKPKADSPFFVSLLTGPNNEVNYTYIGLYLENQNTLRITAKSKQNPDSLPVKVFNWAVGMVARNKAIPTGYEIHHEGKCCRCGRTLTTTESVAAGIGPECQQKVMGF